MRKLLHIVFLIFLLYGLSFGQSGKVKIYSESDSSNKQAEILLPESVESKEIVDNADEEIIRVETNLVIIPTQVSERSGKSVTDLQREEFKIFENGIEQEIAYFSNREQPFTVALLLDMSYSSVFKLEDIQSAAFKFINQLRPDDKVTIISFAEDVRVLCELTNNKKVLQLAIEAAKIASGTSLYSALDLVLNEKLKNITNRKAVVLLSDGVDTSSSDATMKDILAQIGTDDILIYPIQYNTYNDVQKNRKKDAQIIYDDNDRPIIVKSPKTKGERKADYEQADEFIEKIADQTGGRIYKVNSTTNLNRAFGKIADELRKIYSIGYYPSEETKSGVRYALKVRIYRPNLIVRARENYVRQLPKRSDP